MRPALLVLAGALVYANSLSGVFTFDDMAAIVENETIRRLWPLTGPLSPPDGGLPVAGRPLVNLSFALNYGMHGLEVAGYHVVNIGFHVVSSLLLFGVVRRTFDVVHAHGPPQASANLAFLAALVWLVHPLLTEAVNYVSQRTELMMAFFYLLTLYASVRAATAARGQGRWVALAVVACVCGMACKEVMVTAPLLVVIYDRVFLFGSLRDAMRARRALYSGLAGSWVVLAALNWSGPRADSAGFATGVSVWTYLLNQTTMLVEYLQRAMVPLGLVLDYGEPQNLTLLQVLPQALAIASLLALTIVALLKWPRAGFLAAAFFIILAPSSSFVPIATEVGAERRMYLPLAALVTLAVVGGQALTRRAGGAGPPRVLMATGVLIAVAFGALTWNRNTAYASEIDMWREALALRPHARAHRNYATLLKREGYTDEVIDHLRQSLDGHPESRYALGYELYEQRRIAEAVDELRQFASEMPDHAAVTTARAMAGDGLLSLGRYQEASREFSAVVKARPGFGKAWSNLGIALAQSSDRVGGVAALRRAVQLEPSDATAQRNLALLLLGDGNVMEALPYAEAAARLEPGNAVARYIFGAALASAGQTDRARQHLRTALEIDPSLTDARDLLASIE